MVLIGTDSAYASFSPEANATLSSTDKDANANIVTTFNLPAPNVNFGGIITFTPPDFLVATDADLPDGAGVTFLSAGVTLGLINGPCSPGGVTAEFNMMDATTNISGPTVVFKDDGDGDTIPDKDDDAASRDPGTIFEIHEGASTDSYATLAELPKGAAKYPDFLLRIFKDASGQTLQPRARLYGQTQVVGNNVSLNFVFFEPGTTFKNPITGQVFTTDPALGYPSVTILQDLGDPDVNPNPDSTITDFCTPLNTNITTCGVTQDRSLMNRDNPCPSASGTKVRQNPSSDTTANFVTYALGLPDADADGLENSFDTCPYVTNVDNPRTTAGTDSDGLDPACDPDSTDWCGGEPDAFSQATKFGTDCDKDGFVNSADNCPLISNADQANDDADAIGDACDQNRGEAEGGNPLVVRVVCIDIGAGGGKCLGEDDIEADLDHISIIGGPAASVDTDGDGVPDADDRCPGTPAGATVDAVGCTPQQAVLDDDKDGVLNASDACPGTAAGETVDANGCSAAQLAGTGGDTGDTGGVGGGGVGGSGVGALAPAVSSIPGWGALASALGGAGLLGSLGAFASRIFRRRR
ncbi:MAG: thrombospondin type 3 repeat-containing protein [Dehalococcoidia bacterium]|nr:thrombospondin type 3 repeat-containing protein [Dehalococcoidia bacterium]